ncbi:fibrobacter succinogenes major paralogous domain-containing protein [Flavobacteriales bacterium]|nr:fibrobacter succinogenes major paralogous domain-containing protein [Flavobacteriales bacterium]
MELQDDGSHLLFLSNGNTQVVTFGCTNPEYAEFDEDATIDDGSCSTIAVFGCTNPSYEEFSSSANSDDGSCLTLAPLCANPTLDGHVYAVTIIGDQCWFAENLRTTVYDNGEEILEPHQGNYAYLYQHNDGRQIAYAGNQANVQEWGRLYNWHAVNDERGLCPSGWHVPSLEDIEDLIDFSGSTFEAGLTLKSIEQWPAPNVGATNELEFSAVPSGSQPNCNCGSTGGGTSFTIWTRNFNTEGLIPTLQITSNSSEAMWSSYQVNEGNSVRCIKD